jgi:hypothetical protein
MSKHPERYDSEFGSNPCADASYFNNLEVVSRLRRMFDLRFTIWRFESRESSPTAMRVQRVKR